MLHHNYIDTIFLEIKYCVPDNTLENIKKPINWVAEGDLVHTSSVHHVCSIHTQLLLRLCSAARVTNFLVGE